MVNELDEVKILSEIRDLLKSRDEKYEQYIQQSQKLYKKQVSDSRNTQWSYLIWLCFAVTVGVFLGGLMLRGLGAR